MFHKTETTALFVDGQNFYSTARALEMDVDYRLLRRLPQGQCHLLRASYFTPMAETEEHVAIRPMVDRIQYNGWNVVTTPAREYTRDDGRRRIKGSIEVELALSAARLAPCIHHAVLFTGNRDFCSLVDFLQDAGVRVTVVSSIRTEPVMLSDELRRKADQFVELVALREEICKPDRECA